jgi:hypothetical protein
MGRKSKFEMEFQDVLNGMYQESSERDKNALKIRVFVNVVKQQDVYFERSLIKSLQSYYKPAEELEEVKVKIQVMNHLRREKFDWNRRLVRFSFGFFKKLTAVTLAVALLAVSQGIVSPVTLETSFANEMRLRVYDGIVFVNGSPVDYDVSLNSGDFVRTFEGGKAEIVKTKGNIFTSLVRLSEDTHLKITLNGEENARIELNSGKIWALASGHDSLNIVTSNKDRALPHREGSVVTSVDQGQVSVESDSRAVRIQPENKVNVKVVRTRDETVEDTDVFIGEFVTIPHSSLNKRISRSLNRGDEWVRENQVKDMALLEENQGVTIDFQLEAAGDLPGTASDAFNKLANSVQTVFTLSSDEKIARSLDLLREQFAETVVLSERSGSIDIKSLSSYEKTFSSTLDLFSATVSENGFDLQQEFLSILEKQFLSLSQVAFGELLYPIKLQVEQFTLAAYDRFEYVLDSVLVAHKIVKRRLNSAHRALQLGEILLSEEMLYEALDYADMASERAMLLVTVEDQSLVLNDLTERLSLLSPLEISDSLKVLVQRMRKQTVVQFSELSNVIISVQPDRLSKSVSGIVVDSSEVETGLTQRIFGLAP